MKHTVHDINVGGRGTIRFHESAVPALQAVCREIKNDSILAFDSDLSLAALLLMITDSDKTKSLSLFDVVDWIWNRRLDDPEKPIRGSEIHKIHTSGRLHRLKTFTIWIQKDDEITFSFSPDAIPAFYKITSFMSDRMGQPVEYHDVAMALISNLPSGHHTFNDKMWNTQPDLRELILKSLVQYRELNGKLMSVLSVDDEE